MKKIYEQTNDLHVRNIVFYGDMENNKIYVDEECTEQATQAQVEDAFIKGQLLVKILHFYFVPNALHANVVAGVIESEGEVTGIQLEAIPTEAE